MKVIAKEENLLTLLLSLNYRWFSCQESSDEEGHVSRE